MSKERELIEQMKEALAAADVSGEASAQAGNAGAATIGNVDIATFFDALSQVGGSMVSNPLFYIKAVGVLILTVMIILLAFQLISGS